MKLELRAITNSQRMRDRAVMISSTMPSAKYSCSGSPLMLSKGRTAIEGFVGQRQAQRLSTASRGVAEPNAIDPHRLGDVLELLLAESSKPASSLPFDVLVDRAGDADAARLGDASAGRRC